MSIQFVLPQPNQPFGWGYFFSFTLQPPTTTSPWDVEIILTDAEETGVMLGQCLATGLEGIVSLRSEFDDQFFPGAIPPIAHPTVTTGEPVTLRVNIKQAGQVTITDRILVTYEPLQGRLKAIEKKTGQTVGGGLTVQQDATLTDIRQATFAAPGGGWDIPIDELITPVVPIGLLRRELIGDRVGYGELNPPGAGLNAAYGVTWEWLTVPSGIGLNEGQPGNYDVTMLELAAVHQLADGHVLYSDWTSTRSGNAFWWPTHSRPLRLLHYITPGVVVRFWWLVIVPVSIAPQQLLSGPGELSSAADS